MRITFEIKGYADALRAWASPERVELQLRALRRWHRGRRHGYRSGELLSEIEPNQRRGGRDQLLCYSLQVMKRRPNCIYL